MIRTFGEIGNKEANDSKVIEWIHPVLKREESGQALGERGDSAFFFGGRMADFDHAGKAELVGEAVRD